MAAEEHLTDVQLANELAKYGEKVDLPLKRGKRPVLLKKLNHLRVRNKKENTAVSSPRTSAFFSTLKNQRNSKHENETEHIPKAYTSYSRDSRRKDANSFHQSNFQPVVSDDSDVDAPSVSPSNYNRYNARGYRNDSEKRPSSSRLRTPYGTPEKYSPNNGPRTLRDRTPISSRGYDRDNNETFSQNDDDYENTQSPPRSKLYPDLGALRSHKFDQLPGGSERFEFSDSETDERDKSFPYSSKDTRKRNVSSSFPSRSPHRELVGGPNRAWQLKSSYFARVPRIIIIIAILFFVVLAASYIVTNRDVFLSWFPSSGSDDVLLICSDAPKTKVCYRKEMVDQALQYLGKLFIVLSAKKGQVLCGDAKPGQDSLTVSDLQSQMYKYFSNKETNVELLLECCLQHILVNPHWKIRALQENGTVATNTDEIARLESEEPSMGVLCRLRKSCFVVFYELCLAAAAVGIVVLLSMLVKHRLKKKELEQREVYKMVEEIIDILQEHYEQTKGNHSDESKFLAVQHVRDQLLPPARRQKLQPIWDKAVAFIDANESRVRMETRLIQGDEFNVWRWLQPPIADSRNKKTPGLTSKYTEIDDQISQKPTICLKICKMFNSNLETDEDWEDEVINAVLEKCRGINSIVHARIGTDVEQDCVFIKCSNLEAAIEAKDELHGWRRKGRIATVKYMKIHEYHMLFPEAQYATRPLYPGRN